MDWWIGLLLLVLAVAAGGGYWLYRVKTAGPDDDEYLRFHCPHCKRRLRYRARQKGHSGMCPRCGGALTFPLVPEE